MHLIFSYVAVFHFYFLFFFFYTPSGEFESPETLGGEEAREEDGVEQEMLSNLSLKAKKIHLF